MAKRICSIDGCDKFCFGRGWCQSHYARWRRHGDPLVRGNRACPAGASPEQRLRYVGWTVVQRRDGMSACWEWNGLLTDKGYGRVRDGNGVVVAHRLAFKTWIGPLGPDELACHRCDNPPCVNPDHLFAGSQGDNLADMIAKGRSRTGERNWNVKLTDTQVAEIRAAYLGIRGQQRELAEAYGVTRPYISKIVRGSRRRRPTNAPPVQLLDQEL